MEDSIPTDGTEKIIIENQDAVNEKEESNVVDQPQISPAIHKAISETSIPNKPIVSNNKVLGPIRKRLTKREPIRKKNVNLT